MKHQFSTLTASLFVGVVLSAPGRIGAADDVVSPPTSRESEAAQHDPAEVLALSRRAAEVLGRGDVSEAVVDDQDAIVAILSQLLEGAETKVDASVQPLASQRTGSTPGGNGPASGTSQGTSQQPGNNPGAAESSGLAPAADGEVMGDLKRREGLADAVWGHLPPKVRDELYRSYTERYVPKYDQLLRRYFEALAASASAKGAEGMRD